jgi:PAS domain S-box-containing protein
MDKRLKLLFAEDVHLDYELAVKTLRSDLNFDALNTLNLKEFQNALLEFNPDIVVSDYLMPDFNGLDVIRTAKAFDEDLPVIILTGSQNEETAVQCMREGASDYVLKENLKYLTFAIKVAEKIKKKKKEEKKQTSELIYNEDKFRRYIDYAPEGIFIVNENGKYIEANKAAVEMSGFSREELLNVYLHEMLAPETKERGFAHFEKVKTTGEAYDEILILKKDGTKVWWAVKAVSLPDEQFMGFISDITDRKNAEIALSKSEHKFKTLINGMLQGLALHEVILNDKGEVIDYRFLEMNESYERLTGLKKENCIGKTVLEILPDTEAVWIEKFGKVATTGEPMHFQDYSGALNRYYEVVAYSPVANQFAAIVTDITESKKMSLQLKASEEKYRLLAENSTDVIFTTDLDLRITYISPAIKNHSGYSVEESLKQVFWDNVSPETATFLKKIFEEQMTLEAQGTEDPNRIITIEFEERHKDGRLLNIESTLRFLRNSEGQPTGIIGVSRDVSERKQLEKNLRESEERNRQIVEESNAVVWETDINGLFTFVSPLSSELVGYLPEELVGKKHFYDLHPQETREAFKASSLESYKQKKSFRNFLNVIVKKDGKIIYVSANGSPILDEEGNFKGYRGANQDITDRIKAQNELTESEARLRAILDASKESVFLIDINGKVLVANQVTAQRLNVDVSDLLNNNIFDFIPEETGKFRKTKLEEVIRTKKEVVFEDTRFGRTIMNYVFPVLKDGNVVGFAIYGNDITDFKIASEKLVKNEESLRFAQHIAKMGSWELDLETNKLSWSENYYKILGLQPFEVQPSNEYFLSRAHPDDREMIERNAETLFINKSTLRFEFRILMPDNSIKWLENIIVPIHEDGILKKISGVNLDINDRKTSEIQLAKRNFILSEMNRFAIEMTATVPEEAFAFMTKRIEIIFETKAVIGSIFNQNELEFKPQVFSSELLRKKPRLNKIIQKIIDSLSVKISTEKYEEILKKRELGIADSLHEVTFGTMSRVEATIIEKLLGIHFFVGMPLFSEEGLMGSIILAFEKNEDVSFLEEIRVFASTGATILSRKKAEQKIKFSEERYRLLFENSSDYIAVTREGAVLFANTKFYDLFHLNHQPKTRETIFNFIKAEDRQALLGFYYSLNSSRETKTIIVNSILPDQQIKTFEITALAIDWEGQKSVLNFMKDITYKQQSELKILRLKDEFERIFHATQDCLFLVECSENGDFRYIRNNLSHQQNTGISFEEIAGKTPAELVGPEIGKVIESNYNKCKEVREILSYEEVLTLKGEERIWHTTLMPVFEGGMVRYIVGSSVDITEKKIAEEKNTEITQRLQAITNSAYDGIVLLDDQGKVVFWNRASEEIFGYKEGEIIGNNLHSIIAPEEYHSKHMTAFADFIKTGKGDAVGKTIELVGLNRKKQRIPIELALSSMQHKGRWMAVGIVRDITERKKAAKEVEEGIKLKNLLFDVSNDGIVLIDSDHKVFDANDRFCEMLGYDSSEVKTLHTWDFEYRLTEEEVRNQFRDILGIDSIFDSIHQRKDGSYYDVEVSAKGFDWSGQHYVVCVCRDISERKNAERDLRQKMDELERFNNLSVGRELKMIELKKEINLLLQKLGEPEKYTIVS